MADVNVTTRVDSVTLTESVGLLLPELYLTMVDAITILENVKDMLGITASVYSAGSVPENIGKSLYGGYMANIVTGTTDTEMTINGANYYTKAVTPMKKSDSLGVLNVSVEGSFTATVFLQRSFDSGTTWYDVESYAVPTEKTLKDKEIGVRYRLGVKTGGYTTGDIYVRLGTV